MRIEAPHVLSPVTIFGWLLSAIGFLLLLAWVPIEQTSFGIPTGRQSVFNLHRAEITRAIISAGFVLVIIGVIARGFEMLVEARGRPSLQEGNSAVSALHDETVEATYGGDPEGEEGGSSVFVRDRQGREREIRRVGRGRYEAETISGPRSFASLDEAKRYFE